MSELTCSKAFVLFVATWYVVHWYVIPDHCHVCLSTIFKQIFDFEEGKTRRLEKQSPDLIFATSGSSGPLISLFPFYLRLLPPPLPLLTHRLLVNPFPVFSFTHPLLSVKPSSPPKISSITADFSPSLLLQLRPLHFLSLRPPTHTDSPPLTVPPVFFGDCVCVSEAFFF